MENFIIKVPRNFFSGEISISSIGYKISKIAIDSLKEDHNLIELTLTTYPIKELNVYNKDPYDLLLRAKEKN
jgi:hypothetical protein